MLDITNLKINIEKALEEIRPFLLNDGGDVELINVKNNIVEIRFLGACNTCNINKMTLKNGVEATIKKYAPQVIEVLAVS
ncbi:MAG TPA: NifU family protein [Flavobacteriaceae bacterium]|nr:NifU family protein [Flavobacteriaceae bacterium]HIP26428.1 NifU family protein [Flavobacteriaceae bacterium]